MEGGNPKAERAAQEAPEEPYNDPRLSQRERQVQAREGRIDNLRRNVMHNLSYCHIQSLPPGFENFPEAPRLNPINAKRLFY